MKAGILLLALITTSISTQNFKDVLCDHPWQVEYIKTINGTNDPNSALPASEMATTPPLCGQIISFKEDSTCEVKNKGKGMWSEVDKCLWSIDKPGNLKFRNKGLQFEYGFTLSLLSFSKDSILLYTTATGIESGVSSVTVYKLKNVKSSN